MTARVQIVVEAKDAASGVLRGITGELGAFGGIIEELTAPTVNWGNVWQQTTSLIISAIKQSVTQFIDYANEVRNLQAVTGATAEEASRIIQVFDDFKISAEQLTPAIRAMTNEGITPSIASIAQLSDQYLALAPGQERAAFLMKNFGRAGLEMAEIMSKGGTAIQQMSDGINSSLVLTEQAVTAAREYELALDEWNDTVESVSLSFSSHLIPALNNVIALAKGYAAALKSVREGTTSAWDLSGFVELTLQEGAAAKKASELAAELKVAADEGGNVVEAVEPLSRLGDMNVVMDFQINVTKFEQSKAELEQKLNDLRSQQYFIQMGFEDGAGDEAALKEVQEQIANVTSELKANEQAFQQWQKQTVFALLQAKMAAGGLDDVEFGQLLQIGEAMGVIDPEVAAMAQDAIQRVAGAAASLDAGNIEDAAKALGEIEDVASGNPIDIKIQGPSASDITGIERMTKALGAIKSNEIKTVKQDLKEIYGLPDVKDIQINVTYNTTGDPPTGFAGGGSFIVPNGYPNDSFMMGVSSGERVSVATSAQQQMGQGGAQYHTHNYYGAKIMLEQGAEGQILASLTA